jgi:hypothetical protein
MATSLLLLDSLGARGRWRTSPRVGRSYANHRLGCLLFIIIAVWRNPGELLGHAPIDGRSDQIPPTVELAIAAAATLPRARSILHRARTKGRLPDDRPSGSPPFLRRPAPFPAQGQQRRDDPGGSGEQREEGPDRGEIAEIQHADGRHQDGERQCEPAKPPLPRGEAGRSR